MLALDHQWYSEMGLSEQIPGIIIDSGYVVSEVLVPAPCGYLIAPREQTTGIGRLLQGST